MANMIAGVVNRGTSIRFLLALMATIRTTNAFQPLEFFPRSSSACPSSYDSCGGSLPDYFCCSSSSTCISLDDNSSAICCPSGSDCGYISPIVCDVQEQNATLHPKSSVKTTKLDDQLPQCGDACCPFGYTCQGNSTCVLNKKSATTQATTTPTPTPTTTASTATNASTLGATFTPIPSTSASASNQSSASSNSLASKCPSFPSKAVVAGFFPGALFGAVLALLISTCLRHRRQKKEQQFQDPKSGMHWSQRSSSGAVIGISSPIASEEASYRTDFLLRPESDRRASAGGRSTFSKLSRTGSRVRSLFSNNPRLDKDVPPIPTVPDPVTPPRQREPSTESIKVYSPPGAFAQSKKFLGPEPYPGAIARPDTTFTDLVKAVGFHDRKGNPTFKVTDT
ncbi:uncharacterized protein N7459_005668 [Penicillium hispanicum]|uniref:uncharacterized protein n=1 Tax=Penicillium hispanicum TaxID=1080232 RepID=UPI0025415110|nr:uncharacterized protein N7459_005668 [Penicillium hispanicum]KAJ5579683.1 hypothetical protein N7459_005668 [Penicillium hispanicum]